MLVIPAIDIMEGKCVRLFQGNFAKAKSYNINPVEQAKRIEEHGFTNLHLIDLDGAKQGAPKNLKILEKIVSSTHLKVDFGGGLRCMESIMSAFNAGAWKVNLGTMLTTNSSFPQIKNIKGKVIGAIDCENKLIKSNGWQTPTPITAEELMSQLIAHGLNHFTITDISRDGTLTEPAFSLYEQIKALYPNTTIWASGGVSSSTDLYNLNRIGVNGTIVGKAIFEEKINPKDL